VIRLEIPGTFHEVRDI